MKSLCFRLLLLPSLASAFIPAKATFLRPSSSSSSSALNIASWGTSSTSGISNADKNPRTNIQAYLPEPTAVPARNNLDGTVLVSGLIQPSKNRSDQLMFDLLNSQDSAFKFQTITAFVDDAAYAKKRLLSRSARYTGLLDKLQFLQATSEGALPEVRQLTEANIKSWVAYVDEDVPDKLETVKEIARRAKAASPTLVNVAVVIAGAAQLDPKDCQAVVDEFKTENDVLRYTIVAVGRLVDTPEGKECYHFEEFGSPEGILPTKTVFSRDESCRLVTELLQLECGVNKALIFAEIYNTTTVEVRLVKGLREAGYSRPQEIDHMVRKGQQAYRDACDAYLKENPDAAKGYTSDAWWLAEDFQKSRKKSAERDEEALVKIKDERTKEIENVAKEWAKREFFRQSMAGTLDASLTEEDFTKSVWERALFEGDLRYRQTKGEIVDSDAELADFKAQQEKKAAVMLKRAKQEMKELLEAEDLVGDDLKDVLSDDSDSK